MKIYKNISFYIVLVLIAILVASLIGTSDTPGKMIYSEFLDQLEKGNVRRVDIEIYTATVELKSSIKNDQSKFLVDYGSYDMLQERLEIARTAQPDIIINPIPDKPAPWWFSLLPSLLLVGLFIVFWFFIMQQSQGGQNRAMSFGKSKARMVDDKDKKKTFLDVAGAEEEKRELEEIVDFLKTPEKYIKLGARIPKGVLLVGPPGTGKTLLAKAVSGEAGVPFFSISGSDFVEMFVGVGASRVRDLFKQAKENSPCIVFIDEIDAVGRHRGAGLGGGNDEREQTLNQLLAEMDGFGVNEGIIIMAATNRPDILDPALQRPGRFDRKITVNYPDTKGRKEILKIYAKGKPLDDDVDLENIAKLTPMFTGADLENVMNEAAILTAREELEKITEVIIKEAIFKVTMGPEKKSRTVNPVERKLTAYHEAGHAITTKTVSSTTKVDRVSIIPVGQAGGYTSFRPNEDKYFYTKGQLIEEIMSLLGGRAAEEIALGEISTGASNDLQRANQIARSMIVKYGMSKKLENIVFDQQDEIFIGRDYGHVKNYSEELASLIDKEIQVIISESYKKVKDIIKDKLDILTRLAETLLEKEKVEEDEFEAIYSGAQV
ncbi:MAG: ATP-dependent zinc metalloprotease FtsH [Clostridiales bacterium]|nr:ATP-dependent zinc metalloprotease FtsH [Clostridiales bacterium]